MFNANSVMTVAIKEWVEQDRGEKVSAEEEAAATSCQLAWEEYGYEICFNYIGGTHDGDRDRLYDLVDEGLIYRIESIPYDAEKVSTVDNNSSEFRLAVAVANQLLSQEIFACLIMINSGSDKDPRNLRCDHEVKLRSAFYNL